MLRYLIDDTGVMHQVDGTDMEVAQQVLQMLRVSEYAVLRFHGTPDDFLTRWSVLERGADGVPVLIGWEGPDGDVKILDSGDKD